MKKIISILVTLSMLIALCASFAFSVSAAGNNPYVCVPKTDATVAVDGDKAADYDKALKLPITRVIALSEGATPVDGTAYVMWGADQKLYFYVDVLDKDLANSVDLIDNFDVDPANTDCVEIYAYWGNGEPVILYRATYDGKLYCEQNAHAGDTKLIQEYGDASKNFEAAIKQTDTGYAAEFKISTYLANLCEGALISFKVVISSTDETGSYVSATSNFGYPISQTRYHKKAATTPKTYLNMLLVGPDGADANFHKYPTISTDDLDAKRYNAEKTAQALEVREATMISDKEVVVKFSKPCTLQWFNNTPVFMGICSGPNPAPVAEPDIDAGDQWQIGLNLDSAVTNDGGTTWKIELFRPIFKKGNGQFADGVFRISETQGLDLSFYMAENDFVGHVISLDGNDYIHANKNNPGDSWDVAYVNYTVNTDYQWDASKETPLPVVEIDISKKLTETTDQQTYTNDPLRNVAPTDDTTIEDPKVEDPELGEGEDDKDSTKNDNNDAEGGNWIAENWWIIAVAAAAVVIVVVVVVIVAGGKKKKD